MNVGELISRAARHFPKNVAWHDFFHRPVCYLELDQLTTKISCGLLNAGLTKGDRIAILLSNGPRVIEFMVGALKAGLVIVPLNSRLQLDDQIFILRDAECAALVFGPEFPSSATMFRQDLPELKYFFGVSDSEVTFDYRALTTVGEKLSSSIGPEDLAWLFYTSGTTGKSKGVMLTHRNLLSMVATNLIDLNPVTSTDVLLHAISLSFAGGFFMLHHLARGVRHVFLSGSFEPKGVFKIIQDERVTTVALVPTMIHMLVRSSDRSSFDLTSLHTVFYGGAAMHGERLSEALDAFGSIFLQSYGLGEAPLTLTVLGKSEHTGSNAGSAGRLATMVSLRIQDDDGLPLPNGETGEIAVRGDIVMKGYWKRPQETAEALKCGWLHTGDVGSLSEEGYLFIMDRKKDLIKSGGMTIAPREVEEVLSLHSSVQEVAVVGVPDDFWGEIVKAFVVLRPGVSASEAEIMDFCKKRLASFKKPRAVSFVKELPKSANNKILRRTLRDQQRVESTP